MDMISGRTRTADQRAAGAEMRENAGMEAVDVEENAGRVTRDAEEMEEVAAVEIVAVEETEEAAVEETAAAEGTEEMAVEETAEADGDVETAAAGARRDRGVLRDVRDRKDREAPRAFLDLMVR